jgi:hypothetical protein
MNTSRIELTSTFLNIDLEVWSNKRLTPLVARFGELNLYDGPVGRRFLASFEASTHLKMPDARARALVRRVRALRGDAKALWEGAARRDFNIGIQAGQEPFSLEVGLAVSTLRDIADVGGRIVVTVYGARVSDEPTRGKKRAAGTSRR